MGRWYTEPWHNQRWLIGGFQLQGSPQPFWDRGVRMKLVGNAAPQGGRASLALTIPEGT